jgi:peptidyl-dipeptidase A
MLMIAVVFVLLASVMGSTPKKNSKDIEAQIKEFIDEHVKITKPLYKEYSLAYWDASISGKDEDYAKAADYQYKLEKVYTDKSAFEKLKKWRASGKVKDKLLKRQLDVLYLEYLGHQIPEELLKEIIEKGNEVEKIFNTFRGTVGDKKVTMNEIEEILRTSTDSEQRKAYWEAQKQVGEAVENKLKELIKLRNKAARLLGFSNYYSMALYLSEQDEDTLINIFDELDRLTRDKFKLLKKEIDEVLSKRYGIKPEEMMPWHYNDSFFQEAPLIYEVDFDKYLKNTDVLDHVVKFYSSIGLETEDIIKRSDLYEKEGKNPHAYSINIDKEGDVRILLNLENNTYWLDTVLHELGHAVYDKYISRDVPFILRDPAHIFTTEAIAMMFGRFSKNERWIKEVFNFPIENEEKVREEAYKMLRAQALVFSRWSQVMFRFERELYRNPDQNLNKLWWSLVQQYQLVTPPPGRNKPDYAAKIHFSSSPVYYHNYQLGELMASQVHNYIVKNILKEESLRDATYVGKKEVGDYLKEKIFGVGATMRWDEFIKNATGEPLTSKYFAEQFAN